MTVPLFLEPIQRVYSSSSVCSRATWFTAFIYILAILLPILLTYSTTDFWVKEISYREQPNVINNQLFLLTCQGQSSGAPLSIAWSNIPGYNQLNAPFIRTGFIQNSRVDSNKDGVADYFTFNISIPFQPSEAFYTFRLAMLFQYELSLLIQLSMDTLLTFEINSGVPIYGTDIEGELMLVQESPLLIQTPYGNELGSIWDWGEQYPPTFSTPPFTGLNFTYQTSWPSLLQEYAERTVRSEFVLLYSENLITPSNIIPTMFQINGKVNIPKGTTIIYSPTLGQMLKYGWIQYFSVAFITFWLGRKIINYALFYGVFSVEKKFEKIIVKDISSKMASDKKVRMEGFFTGNQLF